MPRTFGKFSLNTIPYENMNMRVPWFAPSFVVYANGGKVTWATIPKPGNKVLCTDTGMPYMIDPIPEGWFEVEYLAKSGWLNWMYRSTSMESMLSLIEKMPTSFTNQAGKIVPIDIVEVFFRAQAIECTLKPTK